MKIRISDHAVLRYIERHHKIDLDHIRDETNTHAMTDAMFLSYLEEHCKLDVEAIKDEILPETIRSSVSAGARGFTVNGIQFRVRNNCVVTGIIKNANRSTKGKGHYSNGKSKRHFKGRRDKIKKEWL